MRKGTLMGEYRKKFAFEEPRGEEEQSVARVIAEVLDVDRVGRTDSFYDFGGTYGDQDLRAP
jgi:hypothetical protein